MKSMRKLAFLLVTLLTVIGASAQVDTVKNRQLVNAHGYLYKNGGYDSSITLPQDTFKLKYTWRGLAFKDTLPYFWTGRAWRPFGSGTGGTTDTTSLSNRINQKLNITDTANKWVTAVRRSNDSVFYQKGGSWTFAYKDSTGGSSDGYVDSVRFNSTTNILTVYQNTAADQSVYLPPSYLNFDSSYTPLGGMRNDSTGIIKSVRIRRNNVTVTPTQIGDSSMYWNIDVPTTYIDSIRRVGMNVQVYKNGAWENAYTDSVGAGGSGTNNANIGSGYRWLNPGTQELRTFFAGLYTTLDSSSNTNGLTVKIDTASMFPAIRATISGGGGASVPSGNYGNGVVIRNGALAVPGSDSLNFSGGLAIKGTLSATALPTSGVDADSVVVINSSGAFKKRNVSAFARMNTTSAANQFALFNGNGTLYSSSKFVFSDATYPSMSIVGSDPLMYFGGTGAAYPSIGKSGNSIAIYGPSTGKSIGFYDQLVGGKQMLRLYTTSGSVATFSKTAITLDTAVGGPSIGSVHVEYNAGDSTSAATDVGRHMFRGIGRTYANAGSFNTFYSTVEAGNTTYSQDHIISWQSDAKKTGANTLNIIYHLGILGDSIKAGTVNNRWGVYMYDAKVTAGATLAHQSALRVPKLASAVRNYDMFSDSAQTVKMDGNLLIGDSSLATGARKTIHLFNGTAPSSNISGSILYSESGEFKIRNGSGAINTLSGNAVFSGTITTADPGAGAGAWKFGQFHSASGLILDSAGYIEVNIGGTVYWLALAATPFPKPNPKP